MNNISGVERPRAVVAKLSSVTLVSVVGGGGTSAQAVPATAQPPVIHQIPVAVPL
jgi:hypothetical protein